MDRFEQLSGFVSVVARGSFTRAAAELGVSQSTVSKWVQGLEDDLGVRLLDRTTRSQRVTAHGQRFYERALAILELHDTAVSELETGESTVSGRVRMSLPSVFGRRHVLPLLMPFLERHPELRLDLVLVDRYVSLVDEGFDLVLRVGVQLDSTLRSHALADSDRRLVASPAYLSKYGEPCAAIDLEQHECLVHTEPSGRPVWELNQAGERQRVFPEGRVRANSSEATLELARAGFGIALLASWLVDDDLRRGELVQVLPELGLPKAPIRALTAPGAPPPFRVRAVIDYLSAALKARLNCSPHPAR